MDTSRLYGLLVVGFILATSVIAAKPLGSEWTYQGQLNQSAQPVNGSADFEFKLWDDPNAGTQIGATVAVNDVSITDGLFAVQLDFGQNAFGGGARWLDIAIRSPAGSGSFTTLTPRQLVSSAPYALQTRGLFVDEAGAVGVSTNLTRALLNVVGGEPAFVGQIAISNENFPSTANACDTYITGYGSEFLLNNGAEGRMWALGNDLSGDRDVHFFNQLDAKLGLGTNGRREDLVIDAAGNTGMGTSAPDVRLEVAAVDGAQPAILTTGGWDIASPHDENLSFGHWNRGSNMFSSDLLITPSGAVGIGTTNPSAKLQVHAAVDEPSLVTSNGLDLGYPTDEIFTIGSWNPSTGDYVQQMRFGPGSQKLFGAGLPKDDYVITLKDDVVIQRDVFSFLDLDTTTTRNGRYAARMEWNSTNDFWSVYRLFGPNAAPMIRVTPSYDAGNSVSTQFEVQAPDGDWEARAYVEFASGIGYTGTLEADVLTVPGKFFKIDHPLDPAHKYLYHSCVESPDMKNVYDGVVTTRADGYATVTLPAYCEALNRDFRYQLTVIDEEDSEDFVLAKVVEEIHENQFRIRTSVPNTRVSWQVTGIRHDAFAEAYTYQVEVEKRGAERGRYMHPRLFNQPDSMGISAIKRPELGQQASEPGQPWLSRGAGADSPGEDVQACDSRLDRSDQTLASGLAEKL